MSVVQAGPDRFLGKAAARPHAVKFALADFVDRSAIPPVPPSFGHQNLVRNYQMLGNDSCGCCVWSDAAHQTMLWNAEAGRNVMFTPTGVISDYSATTGYDPHKSDAKGENPTDQGTDMQVAAEYRRTTGVIDASGQRHKIAAYLALDPGNLDDLWAAAYLFGTVSVGVLLPQSAVDQFDAGREWTFQRGSPVLGGHCLTLVGKHNEELLFVTWGRVQPCTIFAFTRMCDEALAYVSEEALTAGKSLEGFDRAALIDALGHLKQA